MVMVKFVIPDPLCSNFESLILSLRQVSAGLAREQITCKLAGAQQRFGEAALVDGEQLQRLARF
jgi:hypothetical protein